MKNVKYFYVIGFVVCYTFSLYLFQLTNNRLMIAVAVGTLGMAFLINDGFIKHIEERHKEQVHTVEKLTDKEGDKD